MSICTSQFSGRRRSGAIAAFVASALLVFVVGVAHAQNDTQTVLHLLDYIAVDYRQAVAGGEIRNADEFAEMREFAGTARTILQGMPAGEQQAALAQEAEKLAARIEATAPAEEIGDLARGLRDSVVRAYGVATAPTTTPNLKTAAALYSTNCAACHGVEGMGDGLAGRTLQPAPTNFRDAERSAQRSPYGLFSTISLGVAGTAMRPFTELSEADRWALAFYVGNLSAGDELRAKGASLWSAGEGRDVFSGLGPVAALSLEEARARFGEYAVALQAYLRANPDVLASTKQDPIEFASETLTRSVQAHARNDLAEASRLAVQAYLEGYELVEARVRNADADLARQTEREMMAYRSLLQSGATHAQVEQQANTVQALLGSSLSSLEGDRATTAATFVSALVILVREGAEAILVIAAILAFLARANRADARRWVHAGWIAALVLGAVTWAVSNYLVQISGASREVTEGVTALISAGLLLYVGYWLHSKSHGEAWQKFIREKIGGALSGGGTQLLALVSFLAVYREVFETVLFYQALAAQTVEGGHHAIATGSIVGAVLLLGICWAILRASVRLPVGVFFSVSGMILVVLAVVFTGQGVAALQEAGKVGVTSVGSIAVPMLGIHPTLQTLLAQCLVIALVAGGYWWAHRAASLARPSAT